MTTPFKKGTNGWILDMNRAAIRESLQRVRALRLGSGGIYKDDAVRSLELIYSAMCKDVEREMDLHPYDCDFPEVSQ